MLCQNLHLPFWAMLLFWKASDVRKLVMFTHSQEVPVYRSSYRDAPFLRISCDDLSQVYATTTINTVPFNSIWQVTGHRPSWFDEMSHLSQVTGPPDEIIQWLTIFLCINNSSIIAKLLTNCRIFLQVTGHNQTHQILNFIRLVTGHTPCRIELNGTVS